MKVFKIDVGEQRVHRVTLDNFNRETKKQAPWYQAVGGREKWYAVCPACDNPVVLIGMLTKEQPYARHHAPQPGSTTTPIKGIVDHDNRLFCPYYDKRKSITKAVRREPNNPTALAIKNRVREQFDRIIWLLNQSVGFVISKSLAEKMLLGYQATEGWLYRGATLSNIPWTLAYMSGARMLVGRYMTDAKLGLAICKRRPDMEITKEGKLQKLNNEFPDIRFAFTQHQQKLIDNELVETLTLEVFDSKETLYSKKIEIEPGRFERLVSSDNENKRNKELRMLPEKIMQ